MVKMKNEFADLIKLLNKSKKESKKLFPGDKYRVTHNINQAMNGVKAAEKDKAKKAQKSVDWWQAIKEGVSKVPQDETSQIKILKELNKLLTDGNNPEEIEEKLLNESDKY